MVVQNLDNSTRYNVEYGDYSNWYFHQQKDSDDYYKHQSGAVRVSQPLALRLAVLLEEFLPIQLGSPHGSEEQDVQDYKGGAGDEVDEEDAETEVGDEVGVHGQRLEPRSHFHL